MASSDMADAFAYMMQGRAVTKPSEMYKAMNEIREYKYIERSRQQGKTQMSCRYTELEMHELQRCGCNICREKYYHMERDYYRGRSYDDYNRPGNYYNPLPMIAAADYNKKEIKVTPIEEPKNYAVKLLVDQLKAQQINLTGKKSAIESQKSQIKIIQTAMKGNNTEKLAIENKIKELSTALKKLGHKE